MKIPGACLPDGHSALPAAKGKARAQTAPFLIESLIGAFASIAAEAPERSASHPATPPAEPHPATLKTPERTWRVPGLVLSLPTAKQDDIPQESPADAVEPAPQAKPSGQRTAPGLPPVFLEPRLTAREEAPREKPAGDPEPEPQALVPAEPQQVLVAPVPNTVSEPTTHVPAAPVAESSPIRPGKSSEISLLVTTGDPQPRQARNTEAAFEPPAKPLPRSLPFSPPARDAETSSQMQPPDMPAPRAEIAPPEQLRPPTAGVQATPKASHEQPEESALAFAVRLESPSGAQDVAAAHGRQPRGDTPLPDARRHASTEQDSSTPRQREPKPSLPFNATRTAPPADVRTSTPSASPATETASVRSTEPLLHAEPKADEPVRQLNIRIAGQGAQSAQVKLSQRGGEVVVSVRGSDHGLVESLRSGLPDLADRLASHDVRVDVWRPGAAADARDHRESRDFNNASQQQAQPDRQQQQPDSQRQRHARPDWLEDFEELATQMRRRSTS